MSKSIQAGILTISDSASRGEGQDRSGPVIAEAVREALGGSVALQAVVPDSVETIAATLRAWCDEGEIDLLLTTGGTGFAPRDVTPEATRSVIERPTPGLAEAMRAASLQVTPHAMLSRGLAGIRKTTLIVNLPGSPKAVRENLAVIMPVLPHAVELLRQGRVTRTDYDHARPGEHLRG